MTGYRTQYHVRAWHDAHALTPNGLVARDMSVILQRDYRKVRILEMPGPRGRGKVVQEWLDGVPQR